MYYLYDYDYTRFHVIGNVAERGPSDKALTN